MKTLATILIFLHLSSFVSIGAIAPVNLANGTQGLNYPSVVFSSNKTSPSDPSVSWKVTGQPPGMSMDTRGRYTGTPTASGNYTLQIQVSIKSGRQLILKDSLKLNHTINSTTAPIINAPFTLPDGKFDARYQQTAGYQLTAAGGIPFPSTSQFKSGYKWEDIKVGTTFQKLPQGMTLSQDGRLSGVPTGSAPIPSSIRTYVFKAKATDLVGKTAIENFTLVINPADPPKITSQCPLPEGLELTAYKNHQLKGEKGKPPYKWTIQPIENFAPGLKLDAKTGIISGKPTISGNFSFSIVLRDANGLSDIKSCSITIHPIPRITTTAIFDCATVGKEVCSVIEAIGGTPPYSWEITPALSGVTISPSGSKTIICGNFTSSGNKSVTVKVTDPKTKKFTVKAFEFSVTPPLQITTVNPLETGMVGESYTDFFKSTGGKPPYTWQILPQIYVSDFNNHRIQKFTECGTVTTYAGQVKVAGSIDGNKTTSATFNNPYGMGFDPFGNIYVADFGTSRIRKISSSGNVSTPAGTSSGYLDGNRTTAKFRQPEDMVADENGNIYVADYQNHRIRKIDKLSNVTTIAGEWAGFSDGIGTSAKFYAPQGICWDLDGDMLLADFYNHKIRKITTTGSVTTVAAVPNTGDSGLKNPHDVKVDSLGNIYAVDFGGGPRISKISMNGTLTTLTRNCSGPNMLSVDRSGFVYVSNTTNHTIEKITPSGNLTKIAGKGGSGTSNGPVFVAMFDQPRSVEINPYEDLPLGLTLNSTSGEISGTPEAYGLYNLTYRVTDSCGNSAISNCELTVEDDNPFNDPNGKILGNVYKMQDGHPLYSRDELATMTPITSVKLSNFDIPIQSFTNGFAGHSNLTTWFQVKYDGFIKIISPGSYTFYLNSDDRSWLRIYNSNNQEIFTYKDYPHGSSNVTLEVGVYRFELDYNQGPPNLLGLQLSWIRPGETSYEIVPKSNFVGSLID
jgi:sugar lactone lactonase YvrE